MLFPGVVEYLLKFSLLPLPLAHIPPILILPSFPELFFYRDWVVYISEISFSPFLKNLKLWSFLHLHQTNDTRVAKTPFFFCCLKFPFFFQKLSKQIPAFSFAFFFLFYYFEFPERLTRCLQKTCTAFEDLVDFLNLCPVTSKIIFF